MTNPNEKIVELDCDIEFDDKEKDSYNGQVLLSEDGNLTVQFDAGDGPRTDLNESWSDLHGTDTQGRHIRVNAPVPSKSHNLRLTNINASSVVISENEGFRPGPDKEVVIEFDVLCFKPNIPETNQLDQETKEVIAEHSDRESPEEKEILYIENDTFEIYGVPFVDTTDRVDIVENEGKRMRTGKVRVRQEKHGTICHHVNSIEDKVQKILELSQLVQETTPQYVRTKVVSIDEIPIEQYDTYYEKLKSGGTANAGGRFSQYPTKVVWGNFPEYLQQAYENYTDRVRDDLHVRQVLGYYVDAQDSDRPVEPQLLSTCSAIELFSLWHAREDEASTKTAEKIQHTIDKLEVETNDLAEEVVPNPDDLAYPEYFWRRERNHVVHGDPEVSTHDLSRAQGAALVLLKRLLRNQLLGKENDLFDDFYDIGTREIMTIDD